MYFKSDMFVIVLVALALAMIDSAVIGFTSRSRAGVEKGISSIQFHGSKRNLYGSNGYIALTLRKESSLCICVGHFEEISFKRDLTFCLVKLEIVYCK